MPWERLANRTPRYALKVRDGKHVKSYYFATKHQADAYRATRKQQRIERRDRLHEDKNVSGKIKRILFLNDRILEHSLVCQGFIKRNGAWQHVTRLNHPLTKIEKSRIEQIKADSQEFKIPPEWLASNPNLRPIKTNSENMTHQELVTKIEALNNPIAEADEKAEANLIIRTTPEIWREFGDLFEWPRREVYAMVPPESAHLECMQEGIRQLRNDLQEQGDSQLEKIAIEQIITCHMQVAKTGYRLEKLEPTDETVNQSKHWLDAHNLAQARLLKSMLTLMRLRKLKVDLGVKLRKNRPLGYEKLDYLTKTPEEIRNEIKSEYARQQGNNDQMREEKEQGGTDKVAQIDSKPDPINCDAAEPETNKSVAEKNPTKKSQLPTPNCQLPTPNS